MFIGVEAKAASLNGTTLKPGDRCLTLQTLRAVGEHLIRPTYLQALMLLYPPIFLPKSEKIILDYIPVYYSMLQSAAINEVCHFIGASRPSDLTFCSPLTFFARLIYSVVWLSFFPNISTS